MLVIEFKNCVPKGTIVSLNKQKVTTLQQAASLAMEFALTHRNSFLRRGSPLHDSPPKVSDPQAVIGNVPRLSSATERRFYCRKTGHLIADCIAWKVNSRVQVRCQNCQKQKNCFWSQRALKTVLIHLSLMALCL